MDEPCDTLCPTESGIITGLKVSIRFDYSYFNRLKSLAVFRSRGCLFCEIHSLTTTISKFEESFRHILLSKENDYPFLQNSPKSKEQRLIM
uniref:Uncharacterized protein n=1 Tax=Romanomermis culicivorax TaxID=13658 RepID=A0A915III8_ROMCU